MSTQSEAPQRASTREAPGKLRSLAADPIYARRRDDLHDLADAVESQDFRGWDRIDLHESFSPPSTIHIQPARGRETLLGALAGASVFLPIMWTWWSLREATDAFNEMIADGSAEGQSFIQLWVSGFDGNLSALHQLSTVTVISVVLISVAIVLFVAHRILGDRSQHRTDDAYAEAEAELSEVLVLAKRSMAESILADGQSFESIIQSSLQELAKAHDATSSATEGLSETVARAQTVLVDSMVRIEGITSALADSAAAITSASSAVETAAEETRAGTRESLAGFRDELAAHYAQHRTQSSDELRAMRDAVAAARDSMLGFRDEFTQTHQRAVDLVDEMAHTTRQSQSDAAERVADNLDVVTRLLDALDSTSRELNSTIGRLEPVLNLNAQTSQAQASELTRTRDELQRFNDGYLQTAGSRR